MKTNTQKNKVWQIIGVSVLCAILVLGAVLGVVFGMNHSSEDLNVSKDMSEQDNLVISQEESKGITLMSGFATTAADGIASKTLTASVNPADSIKTGYSWKVEFVNPTSSWASGKSVTDYVTVTKNASNDLQATLTLKKRFGAQIKVTITCDNAPAVSASATVDCYKVLTGVTIYLNNSKNKIRLYGLGQEQDVHVEGDFLPYRYEVLITPVLGDGTLEPVDTSSKIVLHMNSDGTEEAVSGGTLNPDQGWDQGYLAAGNLYTIEYFYGGVSMARYDVELLSYPQSMSLSESSIKF